MVIEAENVTYEFMPGRGIRNVGFSVQAGDVHAVIGRNGSGKTTLTGLLSGLLKLQAGRLSVYGIDPRKFRAAERRNIGVMMDHSPHWETLTGFQNAYFTAHAAGLPPSSIEGLLVDLFDQAGLSDHINDRVANYSYGLKRKLSAIQSLCHQPDLLVMDEPTVGIDPPFMLRLAEMIRQRSSRRQTTWLAGNDPDWFASVATHVLFLEKGQVIEQGPIGDILAKVSRFHQVSIELGDFRSLPDCRIAGVERFVQEGAVVTALMRPDAEAFKGLLSWVVDHGGSIKTLDVTSGSLKDIFLLHQPGQGKS